MNFKINESSYGGAYDLADDIYFSREQLNEFGYDFTDKLTNDSGYNFELQSIYLEPGNVLDITVYETNTENEINVTQRIDLRKVKIEKDLVKYYKILEKKILDKLGSYLGESINKNKKEIFYVIKDKHGNQLSTPNTDDRELWDRVESIDPRGQRGLRVVVYQGKDINEWLAPKNLSDEQYMKLIKERRPGYNFSNILGKPNKSQRLFRELDRIIAQDNQRREKRERKKLTGKPMIDDPSYNFEEEGAPENMKLEDLIKDLEREEFEKNDRYCGIYDLYEAINNTLTPEEKKEIHDAADKGLNALSDKMAEIAIKNDPDTKRKIEQEKNKQQQLINQKSNSQVTNNQNNNQSVKIESLDDDIDFGFSLYFIDKNGNEVDREDFDYSDEVTDRIKYLMRRFSKKGTKDIVNIFAVDNNTKKQIYDAYRMDDDIRNWHVEIDALNYTDECLLHEDSASEKENNRRKRISALEHKNVLINSLSIAEKKALDLNYYLRKAQEYMLDYLQPIIGEAVYRHFVNDSNELMYNLTKLIKDYKEKSIDYYENYNEENYLNTYAQE